MLLITPLVGKAGTIYVCGLDSRSVVPPTTSPGSGLASGNFEAFSPCDSSLAVEGTFDGLESPPVSVELRIGNWNQNGPLVTTIPYSAIPTGEGSYAFAADDVPFTPELCDSVLVDALYVVVTSESYPAGEIRGQLRRNLTPVLRLSWGQLRIMFR
jgi:hypothetical protein